MKIKKVLISMLVFAMISISFNTCVASYTDDEITSKPFTGYVIYLDLDGDGTYEVVIIVYPDGSRVRFLDTDDDGDWDVVMYDDDGDGKSDVMYFDTDDDDSWEIEWRQKDDGSGEWDEFPIDPPVPIVGPSHHDPKNPHIYNPESEEGMKGIG